MSKAKRPQAARLSSAFSMDAFLDRVLQDLRVPLGRHYRDLIVARHDGPDAFRAACDLALTRDAEAYASIRTTAALRQVAACVSKLPTYGGPSADQRRATALQSFMDAERRCRRTNRKIKHFAAHPMRMSETLRLVFYTAQDEIIRVLGGPPDFEMFEDADFGPGATFALPRDQVDLFYKINGNQDVTAGARQLAIEVLQKLHPRWAAHLSRHGYSLSITPGNRISFVPKSAKTMRTIGIEPSLNVFLQKAVDTCLKRKLRAMAIYLRDQEHSSNLIRNEANSRLSVATIDLSAASDTIAYELVKWMLPPEWFELLSVLRSPVYTLDKGRTWERYHKFSSMGNATTFPVESLIFGALARACCRVCGVGTSRVRVYGDDIIVPPEAALLVIEAFRFAGFRTNTEKTFIYGPFKETCGVDILYGVNIRPVYLRAIPTEPDQVANLFNRLLVNEFGFCLPSTLEYLHSLVAKPLYGPAFYGWTSTDKLEQAPWNEWYEGRNTLCDAYFFAPSCTLPSVRSERYQTSKVTLQRWYRPRPFRSGKFDEDQLYAGFLYGLEEGKPRYPGRHLKIRSETYYGLWPDLVWWPECYGPAVENPYRRVTLV